MSFYLSYDTIVSLNLACDHYQGLSTQDGGVDFNTSTKIADCHAWGVLIFV